MRLRVGIVALTAPAALVTVLLLPPIPQSQGYHRFTGTGVVTGHNLKHVLAALSGALWLLLILHARPHCHRSGRKARRRNLQTTLDAIVGLRPVDWDPAPQIESR